MDFFTRQEISRRTTRVLLAAFGGAVLATAAAVTSLAALLLWAYDGQMLLSTSIRLSFGTWVGAHLSLLGGIGGSTLAVIGIASLYRVATLSRGGGQVARMLGGTEVPADSADPLHRRLLNVVEEMAIASGIPVPTVFVLEQEPGINAFAAGTSLGDAAIALTRGALERLTRTELQGVVAHEFSHIVNGDTRLNLRLMGFAYGVLVISLAGRWLIRSRSAWRRRSDSMAVVIGIGLSIVGAVGLFLSRVIKAAVSRQRERLADASAVQFTRDPLGLAGALKKIGGYTGQLSSVDSEEVAHMLFSRGAAAFRGLFATHPPLLARIQALDPGFTPDQYPDAAALPEPLDLTNGDSSGDAAPLAAALDDPLARAGHIESAAVGHALRRALPATLADAAGSRESSLLLLLALAIDDEAEPAQRDAQWQLLVRRIGARRTERCRALKAELAALDRRLHLPLVEITVPALRQRPAEQLAYLRDLLARLVELAPRQRLFDYVLLRVLDAYLEELPQLAGASARPRLAPGAAAVTLLAAVAAHGHTTSSGAQAAFVAGAATLGRAARGGTPSFEPLAQRRTLEPLDTALASLRDLRPRARGRVLRAVLTTIRHDSEITLAELELFRAIAATLGTPLPPFASLDAPVL